MGKFFLRFCAALSLGACLLISQSTRIEETAYVYANRGGALYLTCDMEQATGSVIGPNMVITANHVVGSAEYCLARGGQTLRPIYRDGLNDYVVLKSDRPLQAGLYPISCEPLDINQTYAMMGYPYNGGFRVLNTVPSDTYIIGRFSGGLIVHLRTVNGYVTEGMSGGPVVNTRGQLVAIINAKNPFGPTSYVKELRDTYLCRR